MVRAKFRCDRIEKQVGSRYNEVTKAYDKIEVSSIVMLPVTANSPENKEFYASTPSGQITLGIVNPEVAATFELGKEYFVDFTPAS